MYQNRCGKEWKGTPLQEESKAPTGVVVPTAILAALLCSPFGGGKQKLIKAESGKHGYCSNPSLRWMTLSDATSYSNNAHAEPRPPVPIGFNATCSSESLGANPFIEHHP